MISRQGAVQTRIAQDGFGHPVSLLLPRVVRFTNHQFGLQRNAWAPCCRLGQGRKKAERVLQLISFPHDIFMDGCGIRCGNDLVVILEGRCNIGIKAGGAQEAPELILDMFIERPVANSIGALRRVVAPETHAVRQIFVLGQLLIQQPSIG